MRVQNKLHLNSDFIYYFDEKTHFRIVKRTTSKFLSLIVIITILYVRYYLFHFAACDNFNKVIP